MLKYIAICYGEIIQTIIQVKTVLGQLVQTTSYNSFSYSTAIFCKDVLNNITYNILYFTIIIGAFFRTHLNLERTACS